MAHVSAQGTVRLHPVTGLQTAPAAYGTPSPDLLARAGRGLGRFLDTSTLQAAP
ncbi:hypothetical protein [Streptomyces subrutilus]|uniref:hypothetical protein n=1 Tax=Streptomyces subrutilus TaxID=36818 RepID=UPI0033D37AE5